MHVEVISTDELGDRSYVVHDETSAIVIDPQRDTRRITTLLSARAITVSLVLETHIHNDYVTGGYALASQEGASYGVNADDSVLFDRLPIHDGDLLTAGGMRVHVVATPGHTDTHLAFVVTDTQQPDQPPAVFSGGSLLYGSVGRTDLVDPARTRELTRAQYHSARHLAEMLPDESQLFPTHGFGSFCSTGSAVDGTQSTIGVERGRNDALTAPDEQRFVDTLVATLTDYPAYYAQMASLNRAGPAAPSLDRPTPIDGPELARRLTAGQWVIDLRDRVAYASDHLRGTVSIELGQQFSTYVGWLVPWGTPVTLIASSPEQISAAQHQLTRIGIDAFAGAATGPLDELTVDLGQRTYYERRIFAAGTAMKPGDVLLDVRRDDERAKGHLPGSIHVPLHTVLTRIDELPHERLWIHCASGYRAGIAASLLARAGRRVVHIDDDYDVMAQTLQT